MKNEELTFPLTLEAFSSYQETMIGRPLEDIEREAMMAWMPVVNNSFRDGQRKNTKAMAKTLDQMKKLLAQVAGDEVMSRFLRGCQYWSAYAYNQWQRDTQNGGYDYELA